MLLLMSDQKSSSKILVFFSIMISLLLISTSNSYANKWIIEQQKNGITVSKRSEKGRELPSFKGTGIVKASLYEILAILRDGKRRREWMERSGVTRVLQRKSTFEAISYQQTIAPWPVSNRDVVMHTRIYYEADKKRMIATFDHVNWKTQIKGVDRDDFVLMPYLKGYWLLQGLDNNRTEVTYMVNTDPGGMLPNWLIKRITKILPYYTLQGLRKQVKRSKKRYQKFLNDYDPNRNSTPKEFPPKPSAQALRYLE